MALGGNEWRGNKCDITRTHVTGTVLLTCTAPIAGRIGPAIRTAAEYHKVVKVARDRVPTRVLGQDTGNTVARAGVTRQLH